MKKIGVDISTLKFGGKKHPWEIKDGNREPPLNVGVDILFAVDVVEKNHAII